MDENKKEQFNRIDELLKILQPKTESSSMRTKQ